MGKLFCKYNVELYIPVTFPIIITSDSEIRHRALPTLTYSNEHIYSAQLFYVVNYRQCNAAHISHMHVHNRIRAIIIATMLYSTSLLQSRPNVVTCNSCQ